MQAEYNGHLEENDRINKVANEIINYYPEIDLDNAKLIASFEEVITTKVDSEIYFKRLFNILFVCHDNKNIYEKVYKDISYIYNTYTGNNDLIDSIMGELIKYNNNERDFPSISEFY